MNREQTHNTNYWERKQISNLKRAKIKLAIWKYKIWSFFKPRYGTYMLGFALVMIAYVFSVLLWIFTRHPA